MQFWPDTIDTLVQATVEIKSTQKAFYICFGLIDNFKD
jgi:hypothetical protein